LPDHSRDNTSSCLRMPWLSDLHSEFVDLGIWNHNDKLYKIMQGKTIVQPRNIK
jgi:hypothetical protein